MTLEGRVALVTGASRGIGRALALGLAREGASVAIAYRGHRDEAEAAAAVAVAAGHRVIAIHADVSNAESVDAAVREIAHEFGFVDILVNNAAETRVHKPWARISEEEWDRVLATNLKSCFLCFRAVFPFMKDRQWGRVINIS